MRLKVAVAALTLTMASGLLAATALNAFASPHAAGAVPPRGLKVFVGYVDNYHSHTGRSHPRPWQHWRKVIFKGCNYFHPDRCPNHANRYDAGALRLDNNSRHLMVVTNARVRIGHCTFRPWPGLHATVPPGKDLILTETGGTPPGPCHTTDSKDNFDTSETHYAKATKCTKNDGKIPVFRVRVGRRALTYRDTGQILNTGGLDPGDKACGSQSETHQWVPIGS